MVITLRSLRSDAHERSALHPKASGRLCGENKRVGLPDVHLRFSRMNLPEWDTHGTP